MHGRDRRALQDTLTAIRLKTSVAEAGHALHPNGERHLRPLETLRRVYPRVACRDAGHRRTLPLFTRHAALRISRESCRPAKPDQLSPAPDREKALPGSLPIDSTPEDKRAKVRKLIEHELAMIADAALRPLLPDRVGSGPIRAFRKGILSPGRGSAANSVVCLGVTVQSDRHRCIYAVPTQFISAQSATSRPTSTLDFEFLRREAVISTCTKNTVAIGP